MFNELYSNADVICYKINKIINLVEYRMICRDNNIKVQLNNLKLVAPIKYNILQSIRKKFKSEQIIQLQNCQYNNNILLCDDFLFDGGTSFKELLIKKNILRLIE